MIIIPPPRLNQCVDRLISTPKVHRGLRLPSKAPNWAHRIALLSLLVLAVLMVVPWTANAPTRAAAPVGTAGPHAVPVAATARSIHVAGPAATTGDLVVNAANSPYLIEGSPSGFGNYIQQGNVTVAAGGVLELQNVVFTLDQFLTETGTIAQRLSHLYTISDQGVVRMDHSALVGNVGPIDPYSQVFLNISAGGQLHANASDLFFAGAITVYGAGSELNLTNGSAIGPNPAQAHVQGENTSIANDSRYAPSLTAAAGAHVTFLNSTYTGTYAYNISQYGRPGPTTPIIDSHNHGITGTTGATWSAFNLATSDTENLTRAVLHRSVSRVQVMIDYTASTAATSSTDNLNFGAAYPFGPVSFEAPGGTAVALLSPAALSAINAVGFPQFLADLNSGTSSIFLGSLNTSTTVTVSDIELNVTVPLEYNLTFSGAGTVFSAIDSSLDINWNLTPGTPVDLGRLVPAPWDSNKLLLSDGASAFLANVTIPHTISHSFWNESAVLPDATSTAVLYRWLAVNVLGAGSAPVKGAQISAFYALDPNQSNNLTATALNQLPSAVPALWPYINLWDARAGLPGYGTTGENGTGYLLLASTILQQSTLPDGLFLGSYHIAVTINGIPNGTRWTSSSVTPYPAGMAPASPDHPVLPILFANYAPSLSVDSTNVLVNGVAVSNNTVAIGQNLSIQVTIDNTGLGPVSSVGADLEYGQKAPLPPRIVVPSIASGALATGLTRTVTLNWTVAENVTGLLGTIHAIFYSVVSWNQGVGPYGGTVVATVPVTIVPAYLKLTYVPPSLPVAQGQDASSIGTLQFIGAGNATVNVTAISPAGRYFIGQAIHPNGVFDLFVTPLLNMSPGTYDLNVSATYNHRTVYLDLPASFKISGSTSTTSVPLLQQTFLGLPLWLWIVIAIALVAGVLIALFLLRSQAKGKLVECGECGELIPEAATICPKCGAEFESDLVRCSRCGSTIPSNSTQCPECAAQLLGPEVADPERQGYGDFVEKFRVEGKKELGDNYGEGAFWDWWKRQPSYVSFNQWKLQQAQTGRSGMGAPPGGPVDMTTQFQASAAAPGPTPGTPAAEAAGAPKAGAPAPTTPAGPATPGPAPPPSASGGGAAMKACANCGKEIPPDYLVCPFCGAVTR